MNKLIRAGLSFSGREKNCGFLNMGDGRFANISATSGIDFPDDGRGMATVDWDLDGDLDIWMTNRNAPRARFLRNDLENENHFLALRLEGNGSSTNRDAIGARVELEVLNSQLPVRQNAETGADEPATVVIKTLRAGEGFLSQSTKWLNFGLGRATRIKQLTVHWPGGTSESFTGLSVDGWYRIVQEAGQAERWSPPDRTSRLQPSKFVPPVPSSQLKTYFANRIPLPTFRYESFGEGPKELANEAGKPTLLTLWLSSCETCEAELQEFAKYENSLRQSGIEIVALAVDGVGGEEQGGPSLAEEKIRTLKFPFISGKASPELVDKLMLVVSQLFAMDLSPVVPMSFLLDRQGYLAALYQGPVEVSELQEDVKRLALSGNSLRDLATPFSGAWMLNHQTRIPLVQISLVMQEAGYREDSVAYFEKHVDSQKGEPEYPSLLVKIGASLHQMGKYSAAENRFREAIGVDPQLFDGHLKLGITLGMQQKLDQSAAALRRAIELSPEEPRAYCYLGTALQGLGKQQEAFQSFQKGLDLVPPGVDVDSNVATAINRAKYVLGLARLKEGEVELGLELLRAAAQWNDQYLFAINNHAWYLACHSDSGKRNPELGVLLAKLAAELTDFKHSAVLDTLSVAEAAVGDFENAISTATRAMELAKGQEETADAIQGRLELFKQSRPYIQQLQ